MGRVATGSRSEIVHDVAAGIRPHHLDLHSWESAKLLQRAGNNIPTTSTDASRDHVLIHNLDSQDHADSPASRESPGSSRNRDQITVELIRLSAWNWRDRDSSLQLDTRRTRGCYTHLWCLVPPLGGRLVAQVFSRAVYPCSRVCAKRYDRCVTDLDIARVDLAFTSGNAQQHVLPFIPWAFEVSARLYYIVRKNLILTE